MPEKKVATAKKSAAKRVAASGVKRVTTKKAGKKVSAKTRAPKSLSLKDAEKYAIIATGGKQYAVAVGDTIHIEKLAAESGSDYIFNEVLLVGQKGGLKTGTPYVEGAKVVGKILLQDRDAKVIVFKKKRRKGYSKKRGHRQSFTRVEITGIRL